ncbi:MAG: Rossmann fold domain-containing protein [Qipengyuania sp.]
MKRVVIDNLPDEPLAAAGVFHQHWLPHAEALLDEGQDVLLIFPPADHTHRAWRTTALQGLARQAAPLRVSGATGSGDPLDAITAYLAAAPGVTGQYLEAAPKMTGSAHLNPACAARGNNRRPPRRSEGIGPSALRTAYLAGIEELAASTPC